MNLLIKIYINKNLLLYNNRNKIIMNRKFYQRYRNKKEIENRIKTKRNRIIYLLKQNLVKINAKIDYFMIYLYN